jgi:hypothetical protein
MDHPDTHPTSQKPEAAAHTPGPWRYGQNKAQRANGKDQWEIGLAPDVCGDPSAVSGGRGRDYMLVSGICRKADARLIAAAPDMLAALRLALPELREDLETLVECHTPGAPTWSADTPLPPDLDEDVLLTAQDKQRAYEAVKTAIARAEGRA